MTMGGWSHNPSGQSQPGSVEYMNLVRWQCQSLTIEGHTRHLPGCQMPGYVSLYLHRGKEATAFGLSNAQ